MVNSVHIKIPSTIVYTVYNYNVIEIVIRDKNSKLPGFSKDIVAPGYFYIIFIGVSFQRILIL